jgi:anthranilate synthase component 1
VTSGGTSSLAPPLADVRAGYLEGRPQIVYRRVLGDLETPLSAYLKLSGDKEGSFLLESVEGGEQLGRYSTIGLEPDLVFTAKNGKARIETGTGEEISVSDDPADTLRELIAANSAASPEGDDLPPMSSGLFGFFAYDFVRYAEHLPNQPEDVLRLPDVYLIRPSVVATFDSVRRELVLVTTLRPDTGADVEDAYREAEERLDVLLERLSQPLVLPATLACAEPEFVPQTSPEDYLSAVARGKEYIAAGDVFQVVLSQRYQAAYEGDPLTAYRQLRRINPSPFLFYLNFAPATLLGASPEILVRVRDGKITIRPIAGTRPRGKTQAEDEALERELLADEKERAEHLMLLDLGRNDVGRSAKLGTVAPTDTFIIERFSHVMHITSNLTGELRDDLTPLDAMMNGFPAGTLTGAPKIRAMEIIDELEPTARGPYGGAIGYFGADGEFDSCIGLRMAVVKDGQVHVQAGAGIVYDSDPEAELAECDAKSAAIKQAFKLAAKGTV